MGAVRVSARTGIVEAVRRQGEDTAQAHGVNPPDPLLDAGGDRIITFVPVPEEAVVVSGGRLRGFCYVQGLHRRADGWTYTMHRVLDVAPESMNAVHAASRWTAGAWRGDTVIARETIETALPALANPA